ncbi:MAG: hypothetical protein AAGD25_20735 [Cyanobacteria bacterium P01_F01_bin.150]
MAKQFMMSGMASGFDMSTQEGMEAYHLAYAQQMLRETNSSLKQSANQYTMVGSTRAPKKRERLKLKPKGSPNQVLNQNLRKRNGDRQNHL